VKANNAQMNCRSNIYCRNKTGLQTYLIGEPEQGKDKQTIDRKKKGGIAFNYAVLTSLLVRCFTL